MTISMSDILCVTNRHLCKEDYLNRLEKIAAAKPVGVILREKDLSEEEYSRLAGEVLAICTKYGVSCILHSFVDAAIRLEAESIHLPLPVLRNMTDSQKRSFRTIGASCHSVEDALEAESLGCTYITAGHIFETDCKKGLPGRGLVFLKNVCDSVSIPVYAIGGIHDGNIAAVRGAGAKGACIMSGLMQCEDVKEYLRRFT
jgi:thiamine-phosphate diphosphorylase